VLTEAPAETAEPSEPSEEAEVPGSIVTPEPAGTPKPEEVSTSKNGDLLLPEV
jgi:hypothetical protein